MMSRILPQWPLLAAMLWLSAGQGAFAADGDWVPTAAQIRELEARLTEGPDRPKTTRPPLKSLASSELQGAARFYYGATVDGAAVIRGELLRAGDEKPGLTIQKDFPIVMDGGCSVINLLYDIKQHRFIRFECNGLA